MQKERKKKKNFQDLYDKCTIEKKWTTNIIKRAIQNQGIAQGFSPMH